MITIRRINEDDAADYRTVRLRALQEHPEAYGATYESMESRSVEAVVEQIRSTSQGNFCIFGAFVNEQLAGLAGFGRQADNPKQRHRARIFQMYVSPEHRRRQIGEQLLEAALAHARQLADLEEVQLAVTVGNDAARNLYLKAGFQPSYIEPRYLKIRETYYDIEWMYMLL